LQSSHSLTACWTLCVDIDALRGLSSLCMLGVTLLSLAFWAQRRALNYRVDDVRRDCRLYSGTTRRRAGQVPADQVARCSVEQSIAQCACTIRTANVNGIYCMPRARCLQQRQSVADQTPDHALTQTHATWTYIGLRPPCTITGFAGSSTHERRPVSAGLRNRFVRSWLKKNKN